MKNNYLSIRVANLEYNEECIPVRTHFSYLHGRLEDDLGYDLFEVTDINSIAVNKEVIANTTVLGISFEGKIEVRCENIDKPCIGYFWKSESDTSIKQHGLICYADDVAANTYAKRCMSEKREHI